MTRDVPEGIVPASNPTEEVRAAIELDKTTPPSEVLREWAKNCEPPPDLWEAEEERPW